MESQDNQVALPLRSHTILGVCEAIGEDFGFNPVFLRIPFAAIVLYSPLLAVGAYLALGIVVLSSRLIFPARTDDTGPFVATIAPVSSVDAEAPQLAKAA